MIWQGQAEVAGMVQAATDLRMISRRIIIDSQYFNMQMPGISWKEILIKI